MAASARCCSDKSSTRATLCQTARSAAGSAVDGVEALARGVRSRVSATLMGWFQGRRRSSGRLGLCVRAREQEVHMLWSPKGNDPSCFFASKPAGMQGAPGTQRPAEPCSGQSQGMVAECEPGVSCGTCHAFTHHGSFVLTVTRFLTLWSACVTQGHREEHATHPLITTRACLHTCLGLGKEG
eukprot:1148470-Pelagomonas_calceolata.AAC.9